MKKLKLILIILLSLQVICNAQVIKPGLVTGGNYSSINPHGVTDFNNNIIEPRLGFQGGVVAEIPVLFTNIFLQPELRYSTKGFSYNGEEFTVANQPTQLQKISGREKYEYLDFPFLIKSRTGALCVMAGPQFSYLLEAKANGTKTIRNTSNGSESEFDLKENLTNKLEKTDFALVGGLGFCTTKSIFVDFRYSYGLKNIESSSREWDFKNKVFQISFGYYPPLQKNKDPLNIVP